MTRKFTVIEGGLAGMDDLMKEFTNNAPLPLTTPTDDPDAVVINDCSDIYGQYKEALDNTILSMLEPAEEVEFIMNKGPFLVDLDP